MADSECPVVEWNYLDDKAEIVYGSFGEFFYKEIRMALGYPL